MCANIVCQRHHARSALLCCVFASASGGLLAAAPTPEQLAAEMGSLRTRLEQIEARQRAPAPAAPSGRAPAPAADAALTALQGKLTALEQEVAALKQVLQITTSNVTLRAPGALTIESGGTLSVKGFADATLQAASALRVRSGATLELEGGSKAELKSAGVTAVRGSPVQLNKGAKPAAFMGGRTAGGPTAQTITDGSTTVLVP